MPNLLQKRFKKNHRRSRYKKDVVQNTYNALNPIFGIAFGGRGKSARRGEGDCSDIA